MKKVAMLASAVLALVMLAACTGTPAASGSSSLPAPVGSNADYRQVIEDARPDELNGVGFYNIATSPEDSAYSMAFDPSFGFVEADMQRYAISIGGSITLAYGVAIILPQDGKQQDVLDQVNGFVEAQKNAQENYLPDQYEIAKSAIVKTADTGEVLLAMCEDAATVMANMEAGLKAGA